MSPGSVCLGPPSAYHGFPGSILVSSKEEMKRDVRDEAEPCSSGMMGTVSKET